MRTNQCPTRPPIDLPPCSQVDLIKGFSTFSAILVAVTFMAGSSAKSIFETILFLFVQHPFDVGDVVLVDLNFEPHRWGITEGGTACRLRAWRALRGHLARAREGPSEA